MEFFKVTLVTDLVKMFLVTLKNHDVLHPLIVHFPIALLSVVPIWIFFGIVFRKSAKASFVSALALMTLGTASLYLAFSSGHAAGELVDRTPQISAVLDVHKDLAKDTRVFFTFLTVIFASLLLILAPVTKIEVGSKKFTYLMVAFLALYSVGVLFVMNTAHQGGLLVHQQGVHAMIPRLT